MLSFSAGVLTSVPPDPTIQEIFDHVTERQARNGKDEFYFDGEVSRLELEWSRGLPGRWEVGAQIYFHRASGGAFDSAIDSFHESFGFPDSGRNTAPVNDVGFILATPDGGFALDRGDVGGVELGDLTLMARYGLPDVGKNGHAEVGIFVELPTGNTDTLSGSGDVDVAVEMSMGWDFHWCRLTFGVGYAALGELEAAKGVPVRDSLSAALAWEFRLRSRHRLFAQVLHATSPFADSEADTISEPVDLVAFGPRLALNRSWYLDVAFVEDFLNHNSDLDVGMTLNLTWLP